MKEVNEMPTEGQFVAIAEDDGSIWAETLGWHNKQMKVFDTNTLTWSDIDFENPDNISVRYFIAEQEEV